MEFYPFNTLRALNAAKRTANRAVAEALRDGQLVRQRCEVCRSRRAEAHHDDYEKPLDVKWLCRFHHRRRDAELRAQRRKALKDSELPVSVLKRRALETIGGPFSMKRAKRRTVVANDCTIELVRQATQEISNAMDLFGVSESRISRRLGISRQAVNNGFAGGFRSLKILAVYADALNCDAVFVLRPRAEQDATHVA